jgi:CRISPR-associated protein Cmr1
MRQIDDEMRAFTETDEFKQQLNDKKLKVKHDARITQIRKYKLITPLFGGGVEPKKNDLTKVIRETSIRGQLRFWWRAMRGFGTVSQMKQRENALFGNGGENAAQSKILIHVKDVDNGRAKPVYQVNNYRVEFLDRSNPINYAMFSLPQTDKELRKLREARILAEPFDLRDDVKFTLEISFPESEGAEIEAAFWAWQTFGGVGGRTRRGFGAVQRTDTPLIMSDEVEQKIKEELQHHLSSTRNGKLRVPYLEVNSTIKIKRATTPNDAWKYLIDKMRQFRQSRHPGSDPTRPFKKGRTYWSEPDEIRRITGHDANGRHKPIHPVRKFPRAEFGLPIIFHFVGEDEPADTELIPVGSQRLASPLILRPLLCADGAVGLALILETPPLPSLHLKGYGVVSTQLVKNHSIDDVANIEPMRLADTTETNVLKSFLKTL